MKGMISVLLTGALVVGMYYSSPIYERQKAYPTKITVCEQSDIHHSVSMKGTACAIQESRLYADSFAVATKIHVKQGENIKKGQVLITLESTVSLDQTRQAVRTGAEELLEILMEDAADGEISSENQKLLSQAAGKFQGSEIQKDVVAITSPIDGTVMDLFCSEGETVSPLVPCISVADLSQMQVKAQVSEENLSKLQKGEKAELSFDALPGEEFRGTIHSIAPYAKAGSILLQQQDVKTEVLIDIENSRGLLRPGYSASAQVDVDSRSQAILVPYSCILQDEEGSEYVIAVGKSHTGVKMPIKTGYELEDQVEILSGLTGNELLITRPKEELIGKKLRIEVDS